MNESELTRVENLWFSSETLILRAGDRGFRVSKAILAARSPVFRSMFELPQPTSDGDQIMDGSHVVQLHDSAADVEVFLQSIFDSSYFMPPPEEIAFDAALGILRLSHKYEVDYLHKRALRHLETVYPVDFAGLWKVPTVGYDNGVVALDLKAIPILQEAGAVWLLPSAFYSVGTYSHSDLIGAGETWERLPVDTQQTCFIMHASLIRAVTRINGFLATDSTCLDANNCNSAKWAHLRDCVINRSPLDDNDPFTEWNETYWEELEENICVDCVSQARAEHKILEAEIWEGLPAMCGFVSWDVLKEQRRAALE